MPVDQEHCRDVFKKLEKELRKVTRHASAERIHKFRTSTRRVETVLEELVPHPDRQTRKLLKILSRVRKKTGKVRDLDVLMGLLRNLKVAGGSGEKTQLLRAMAAQRSKRDKKLISSLDRNSVRDLRQRLKRAEKNLQIPEALDPVSVALHRFAELTRNRSTFTEKTVHEYRITGKRARYIIEMAAETPESEFLIKQFKNMQDVVGDWHDWLALSERAEKRFGGVKDSPLVAAARNLSRAKFREAMHAVAELKSIVLTDKTHSVGGKNITMRKPPATSPRVESAAA